jgi:hypothetical protein
MCSLDPNGLHKRPRFALNVQFGFVQTTDKAGVSELRSLNFFTRRCFRGLNTDTRTEASSCARDALAEGLPMMEFLRTRRDLMLIGVSMDVDMGGDVRDAAGNHLDAGKMVWLIPITRRTAGFSSPRLENSKEIKSRVGVGGRVRAKSQTETLEQPTGNSISLHLHLSGRGWASIIPVWLPHVVPPLRGLFQGPSRRVSGGHP